METFQFYFELIGAAAFAISGAALGIRKEMDLFGVAMLGMTTAVGGGMLRDTMLGLTPPTALRDPVQALVAIASVAYWCFSCGAAGKRSWHNRYAETVLLAGGFAGPGHLLRPRRRHCYPGGVRGQLVPGAVHGDAHRRGRRRAAGCVQCMERPYIFTKHVYACASLAGAAVCHAAVALWVRELGHADGLRCDAGAAHLRRGVPLEPAQSIKNSGVTRVTPLFFCAVRLGPMMPAGSNPAKMRRAAVTGSRNAAMPAITAPGAPANAGPSPGGDGLRVHHNGRDGDRQGLPAPNSCNSGKNVV